MMSSQTAGAMDSSREHLSALVDGELDTRDAEHACAAWRDDADSRRRWHAYQLIGDVLRSDDLASTATRDVAFLSGLRDRLAQEPVVLAPQAPPVVPRAVRRRGWAAPVAAVAGFAAVAGVVVVLRSAGPGAEAPALAKATAPQVVVPVVEDVKVTEAPLTGPLIRDAGLDRYIDAHRQVSGPSALGNQGFLRNVTADGSAR